MSTRWIGSSLKTLHSSPATHFVKAVRARRSSSWPTVSAFHFQDLAQNAAGEGIDLGESSALDEFQQEVIETMEKLCQD